MLKKITLLLAVFLIAASMVYADGCCVNPNVDSADVCYFVPSDVCCPEDPSFYAPENNGEGPADIHDCDNRFYSDDQQCDAGDFAAQCTNTGCCCLYDEIGGIQKSEITVQGSCVGNVVFDDTITDPFTCTTSFCQQQVPLGCIPGTICTTDAFCPGEYDEECQCVDIPADSCPLDCVTSTAIRNLDAVPIKGEKWISIDWDDDCAAYSPTYTVERYIDESYDTEFTTETSSYIDNTLDLQWGLNYNYKV